MRFLGLKYTNPSIERISSLGIYTNANHVNHVNHVEKTENFFNLFWI
jgi:hypothetical protein